jgi:hypothetical protein
VQYDGEPDPTSIHLPGKLDEPRYVVLIDADEQFKKGDLLAARLNISAGHEVEVYAQAAAYYLRMVPVLRSFEEFLRQHGYRGASLQVGEDVGQLDMVACASPHWGPPWLGGSNQSVNTIVRNCVHKNAWAMKQIVQSRPAIVFLVGQASWNMFRQSFGHLIHSSTPLPTLPEDGPYTQLRMTTQQEHRLEFSTTIGHEKYVLSTRLVITPHFSYNENFFPQFRMSPQTFSTIDKQFPAAAEFLQHDPRIIFQNLPGSFVSAAIAKDVAAVLAELKQKYATATAALMPAFYDPQQMMAEVLMNMYGKDLTFTVGKAGQSGYLTRSDGPCQFCVNERWKFPKGCPYGKPDERQHAVGFLEQVIAALVKSSDAATAAQPE